MATEDEEDDLEALRIAVLASMKSRVAEKENSPQDTGNDTEEDPELAALRAAALKTKGQNFTARPISSPKYPSPKPLPTTTGQFQYAHVRGRGRGRGTGRGVGRGGLGMFRGGKNAGSNLIVINTLPEDGSGSDTPPTGRQPTQKDAGNVFLRPQDKWAGSVSDSNSGTSTPTRSKVPNKFSRFDSSGTDTDSDSDYEEDEEEDKVKKDSESEDDDTLNLEANSSSSESENQNPNKSESQNQDQIENVNTNSQNQASESAEIQKVDDNGETEKLESLPISDSAEDDASSKKTSDMGNVSADVSDSVPQNTVPSNTVPSADTRTVVSPTKVVHGVQEEGVPAVARNVKSRLGIPPARQSNSAETVPILSPTSAQNEALKLDAMTPEERALFEARRKKFMQILEVQDLKKTVSLKGIVPPKKAKRELPKQYRHRRNRSRSNSRSPAGKVQSSHRKRERRKRRDSETKSKGKGMQEAKTERKVKTAVGSDSDSDGARPAVDSDSDSSDSSAVPWRFQHTGKSAKRDRRVEHESGAVFERRAEDIAKERRQRLHLERTTRQAEVVSHQKSNAKQRLDKRIPSESRRKRVVKEVPTSDKDVQKQPDRADRPSVKSRLKVDSDGGKASSSVEKKRLDSNPKEKSLKPSASSDDSSFSSSSSSEDDSGKKRDARSIIVSLRSKEGGETTTGSDNQRSDKTKSCAATDTKPQGRTSPVVNITFNGPSEKKTKSEPDRGPVHHRLGVSVRSKRRSSGRESSQHSKPARKVIEEDDKPLKFGIRKTDGGTKSRVRPISVELESSGAKSRRLIEHDSTDVFVRDRTKSASDIILTSHRRKSPERPRTLSSKSVKRRSEERSISDKDTDFKKKIKLNHSEKERTSSLEPKPVSNNKKEKTAEEVLLDERIRKIHERNQAILRRQQEVLNDKKLYG